MTARVGTTVAAALLATAAWAQMPSTSAWRTATGASHAEQATPVGLERRAVRDGIEIVVNNTLAGPVEVRIDAPGTPPRGDVRWPIRTVVPGGTRAIVARLADSPGFAAPLHLEAVPGVPDAQPRDVEYVYPLRGAPLRITQGFGGGFSHTDDENRYAVDFAVEEGTPVLAARGGVVMQYEAAVGVSTRASTDDVSRTNFVRILHDDGTMALYAHLQRGGVIVATGERIRRGQIIAFSGNTGASSGPHLHFAVHANRGLRLQSLPFRMFGPGGILRFALPTGIRDPD